MLGYERAGRRVLITISNYLTLFRIALVPLFWICFFSSDWVIRLFATLLVIIGALTDFWDGWLARRRGEITPFGDFMDPLADKLLILSAFWAILWREEMGALGTTAMIWVAIITARETFLTALRIRSVRGRLSHPIVTSIWGKAKTVVQFVALFSALLLLNARAWMVQHGIDPDPLDRQLIYMVINGLLFLSMLTSVVSGWQYAASFRKPAR